MSVSCKSYHLVFKFCVVWTCKVRTNMKHKDLIWNHYDIVESPWSTEGSKASILLPNASGVRVVNEQSYCQGWRNQLSVLPRLSVTVYRLKWNFNIFFYIIIIRTSGNMCFPKTDKLLEMRFCRYWKGAVHAIFPDLCWETLFSKPFPA